MSNKKVLLGMSGGVDSSVSAIVLKEKGYDVIGCTFELWNDNIEENVTFDAKKVCDKLGIKHYVYDLKDIFYDKVINNFIEEYKKGRTPNPCVECNNYIKFGEFIKIADELECDFIATGHYSKIEYSSKYDCKVLMMADAREKDQSYFLYSIKRENIDRLIFPLQDFNNKDEIRKIAQDNNLEVANKKDSQEICFISNNCYQDFLNKYGNVKNEKGNIVLKNGEVIGTHNGIFNYTIGQRKGIGVSYKEPLYVIGVDVQKNQVIVGEEKELYSKMLMAKELNWTVPNEYIVDGMECYAKIRYRSKPVKASINFEDDNVIKMNFEELRKSYYTWSICCVV